MCMHAHARCMHDRREHEGRMQSACIACMHGKTLRAARVVPPAGIWTGRIRRFFAMRTKKSQRKSKWRRSTHQGCAVKRITVICITHHVHWGILPNTETRSRCTQVTYSWPAPGLRSHQKLKRSRLLRAWWSRWYSAWKYEYASCLKVRLNPSV